MAITFAPLTPYSLASGTLVDFNAFQSAQLNACHRKKALMWESAISYTVASWVC